MVERTLTIDGVEISDASDCYVIAEIGHNHQGEREQVQGAVPRRAGVPARTRSSCRSGTTARCTPAPCTTSPTTTRTASAPPTASTARRSSSGGRNTSSCSGTPARSGSRFFATAFDVPSADFLAEPRHAGLQDRLRRPPQHSAAPARGAVREADDRQHRRRHDGRRRAGLRGHHSRSTNSSASLQCTAALSRVRSRSSTSR